jgi:hypothetical protein
MTQIKSFQKIYEEKLAVKSALKSKQVNVTAKKSVPKAVAKKKVK